MIDISDLFRLRYGNFRFRYVAGSCIFLHNKTSLYIDWEVRLS